MKCFWLVLFLGVFGGNVLGALQTNDSSWRDLTLTEQQQDAVIGVRTTTGFLSLLGSLFILASAIAFHRLKHMSARFIFALSIAALLEAISNLMALAIYEHEVDDIGECVAQGIIMQFSQNASFAWVTAIAINLYLVVSRGIATDKHEAKFHVAVWLWAIACTVIPFASPTPYGPAGLWCWLTKEDGQVYRWVLFYVPLIIMMLVVTATYALIVHTIHTRVADTEATADDTERADRLLARLRAYPIILVLCWIFPLINRIYDAANDDDSFFLYVMHSLTAPLFGFLNALAYGLDSEMVKVWTEFFTEHGMCKQCITAPQPEIEEASSSTDEVEFKDLEQSSQKG